jgi:branched-subunit amino acid aminotransferase/4-amino-4-deoxychorismate lyase
MSNSSLRYCLDGRWLSPGEPVFAPSISLVSSGEGWFETLRVESGRPMFLLRHLDRLSNSVSQFYGADQAKRALQTARRCLDAMSSKFSEYPTGRLRLIVARDDARADHDTGGWQALGEWSAHRSSATSLDQGIDVIIASFAHPGLGHLGKSASYHWSLAARQEALARGASEALLVRDGEIKEGATGAVAWQSQGRWFVHESSEVLKSVTLDALRRAGVSLELGSLPVAALDPNSSARVEGLILISALRLAMAICSCDGRAVPSAVAEAARWRTALLELHAREAQ